MINEIAILNNKRVTDFIEEPKNQGALSSWTISAKVVQNIEFNTNLNIIIEINSVEICPYSNTLLYM